MHDDLQARLFEAAQEIEGSATPMGTVSVGRVRASARRRRIQRRTTQSFAGVAAAAVIALVVTLGAQYRTDSTPVPPAVTDTPTPTATPTSTPAPSRSGPAASSPGPTPTTSDPPVRAAGITDADVLAHLQNPRTGEVWQTRTEAPDFAAQIGVGDTAYRVGTHGDAEIYMTVASPFFDWGLPVTGLYERDSSGVRLIACPSARSGDACVGDGDVVPGVRRDDSTFYDSLTLPAKVSLDNGFDLTTAATRQMMGTYGDVYGKVADPQLADRAVETVRDLGAVAVVTVTWRSEVAGLTNLEYALTTPLGSQVRLEAGDVPGGDFASIRWDDGVVRGGADGFGRDQSRSPGAPTCESARYAVDDAHDTSQWRRAGTSAEGRPVYLPVQGGNSVSRAVRAWHESTSWTFSEEVGDTVYGAAAGYPYPTDESFLAADALYAIPGPDGQWLLGMRDDASQIVYECA